MSEKNYSPIEEKLFDISWILVLAIGVWLFKDILFYEGFSFKNIVIFVMMLLSLFIAWGVICIAPHIAWGFVFIRYGIKFLELKEMKEIDFLSLQDIGRLLAGGVLIFLGLVAGLRGKS